MKPEKNAPAESPANPNAAAPDELARLEAGAAVLEPPLLDAPAAPNAQQKVPTAAVLRGVLAPAFAILAPNWRVSPDEVALLSEAYAGLVDKYFPDIATGPEIAAIVVTFAVFGPRVVAKLPPKVEPPKKPAPDAAPQA